MSRRSDVYALFFSRSVDISHFSDYMEFGPHLLVPNKRTNRIFQYIEEVLPGGLLHAPIAVGAHSQPSAAKADGWQRTTPTCYLVSDLGLIEVAVELQMSACGIRFNQRGRVNNLLYKCKHIRYWPTFCHQRNMGKGEIESVEGMRKGTTK